MKFISDKIRGEWFNGINDPIRLSPTLKQIAQDAEDEAQRAYGWEPVITCILRTPEENDALYGGKGAHFDGVHCCGRGLDVRVRDINIEWADHLADYINGTYEYDPERPGLKVAILESAKDPGSSAVHLHLQVHGRTALRLA